MGRRLLRQMSQCFLVVTITTFFLQSIHLVCQVAKHLLHIPFGHFSLLFCVLG